MPSIIVGASWGGFWGSLLRIWMPGHEMNIQPGLYAIMAATGVLGGVFHSTISLVVLMVEGTHGVDFLFGVILSVVVANFIAHQVCFKDLS
jgi:chloride channel 7